MKFRCERDLLVEALTTAGKAVTNRGTLPVLHGLRLDLSGNDLVITGKEEIKLKEAIRIVEN